MQCFYETGLSLDIKGDLRAFHMCACNKMKLKDTVGSLSDDFCNVILHYGTNRKKNFFQMLMNTKFIIFLHLLFLIL